jgi:hypothetical protein
MDAREIRWKSMGWTHLAQDRVQWLAVVNRIMNLQVNLKVKLSLCLLSTAP